MNESNSRSRREDWHGYLQILLVVGVLIFGLAINHLLLRNEEAPVMRASAATVAPVDIIEPRVGDVPLRIRESGTVVARNSIQLSPQVGGRVMSVSPNLASGGFFEADEVLFRLDAADYQAAVNRALAERSAALADLSVERAEADVAEREWSLVHPDEPIPDLVARVPQIARAEAALESAEAALADARLDLSRVEFSLPFAGRVLSTTIEIGQNLAPGQSYGRANNPSEIEGTVPVTTTALTALSPAVGRPASVTVGRGGALSAQTFDAVVIRADAELNAQTRLANLTLAFREPTELLPGEFVQVEILGSTIENAHLLPESALGDQRTVWVVQEGRLAQRQPPVLYIRDRQVVTAPFDSADGVVTSPLLDPSEGMAVRVRDRMTAESAPL